MQHHYNTHDIYKECVFNTRILDAKSDKHFSCVISDLVVNHIVIDFSGVKQMSHSFSLKYLKSKKDRSPKKVIEEICMSKNICKMLQVTQKGLGRSSPKELPIEKQIIREQLQ